MVTLNLPHDGLTSTVLILYSFGLLGSYPMQLLPVYDILEKTRSFESLPTLKTFPPFKRLLVRASCVVFTAVLAMVVPKFGLFISLIGSFACTILVFVLPVIVYEKLHQMHPCKKWAHRILMAFGLLSGIFGASISVIKIIKAFAEAPVL
jgi:proton-coupled amino acid transporter